jgi:hypothetical protein
MADTYLAVDREILTGDRATPDVMIALPMPDEIASMLIEDLTDFLFIFCH